MSTNNNTDIILSGWQAYYVVLTLMSHDKKSCTTLKGVSINYTVVNASGNAYCTVVDCDSVTFHKSVHT